MTANVNLPDGPKMPIFLRRMKFIFQPLEYADNFAKTYGDTFTLSNTRDSAIVYFSHPQALQEIFAGDSVHFESGRGNRGLRFLLGDNSLILLDGDRHHRQRQLLTPPFHGDRMRTYGETIRQITQQVTNEWKINKPFNIRSSMQEITMRVILRVVFGLNEGQRFQELRQLLTSVLDFMGSPFMSAAFFFRFIQKDLGRWSPWGRVLRLMKQEVYPQPKQFKPERFLERQFSQYEYLPFGGGNRRCIGMAFAQYEMKLVLATIVSQFQLSRVNRRPVRPVRRGLTLAPPAGMQMIATR